MTTARFCPCLVAGESGAGFREVIVPFDRLNLAVLGPVPVWDNEYVVEAYCTYRCLGGLRLRSNIQYVIDPGGTSQNRVNLMLI
jgi:hypothetical protein